MTINRSAALAHCQHAERGNFRSIGTLLRAILNGTVSIDQLRVDHTTDFVLTATELAYLDAITAGVGAASKALVLDTNGDLSIPGDLKLLGNVGSTTPGTGFTGGTGTVLKRSVTLEGEIYVTKYLLDLTGLDSVATDGDIIGTGANPSFFDTIVAAENGTIFGGSMKCLEAPTTGEVDIDVYAADEATGKLNDAISGLTNTAKVIDAAADWTLGLEKIVTAIPGDTQSLYLTVGTASAPAAGTYDAGKFLLTLYGV